MAGTGARCRLIGNCTKVPTWNLDRRRPAALNGEYKLDPRDVLYIYPAANDVMGVTPAGRMVHYTEAEFDLLMPDSAGLA